MKTIRLICRNSRLSLLQAEIVKKKIETVSLRTSVEIVSRCSRGDREVKVSLVSLEGTDFFTEEIFEALYHGEADIAVHSLKDMSAAHFFSHDAFAIVERDDPRDVAIFNPGIENKIIKGETIIVGTCSPRREVMATEFLKKALPQLSSNIHIEARSIRGSVESRLKQLDEYDFDATILATAGLNRLLHSKDSGMIRDLLQGKRLMFLPLVECVPAPCQGVIVAEANPRNMEMVDLLRKINDDLLLEDALNEKREALKYGTGSLQHFGVTTFSTANGKVLYAAGTDARGEVFNKWSGLPVMETDGKYIVSTTDFMGSIFEYKHYDSEVVIDEPVVFVANHKAILHRSLIETLRSKRVWTSGTRTWLELAKKGIWVEGSADAFGLELLKDVMVQPVISIQSSDVHIITHQDGAKHWVQKGWKATPTYSIRRNDNPVLEEKIGNADIIFWTSIHQYVQYKNILKNNVIHLSPGGETAFLLKQHGIDPVIFPTINSFTQWRQSQARLHSVA